MAQEFDPALQYPQIGSPAPRFLCRTTLGERSVDGYRGRWLVFFSHPADFTPVCTSEFLAFARHYDAFQTADCDLLGLSVDSLFSHLAWVKAIKDAFGVAIPFPIAEDPSMAIAKAYGMLRPDAPDSTTVRACFIIDPDGIIRMTASYPMSTGRNVEEILRTVRALQATDAYNVFTPEAWQPGGRVIKPAAVISAEGELDPDWFYRTMQPEFEQ
ncbi:MAG: peroxiredoxin [Hyphomicrobiales bacterium]|nr:peroxiredoxin [Hyphomicrobiales bacterium]